MHIIFHYLWRSIDKICTTQVGIGSFIKHDAQWAEPLIKMAICHNFRCTDFAIKYVHNRGGTDGTIFVTNLLLALISPVSQWYCAFWFF